MKKRLVLILCALIGLANIVTFKELTGLNKDYYKYSNGNGTLTVMEIFSQGRELDKFTTKEVFKIERFTHNYPLSADTVMFRLFKINPLHFWRWGEYIYSWRFRLPYKDWEKIKAVRKPGLRNNDFGLTEF